ncbi:arginine deiminase-related protein [Dokdonella sp.]|uniref:arginine deiminase-related protein n=1 Tax=Dokdonella sp. TaxID=2291710 RepID=UPI00352720D9
MIVTDPRAFIEAMAMHSFAPDRAATARAAFLVSPAEFSLATESASDNLYMNLQDAPDPLRALAEHGELARKLAEDVPVISFPGDPAAPDGVFPNNAFATCPGRLIVGSMRHPVRRRETERADIRAWFGDLLGREIVDLSGADLTAELTGSLVIDRARGIGYCGLSERCDLAGARAMHDAFDLRLTFCFELAAGEYHTNVVLAILAGRAALIAESGFADPAAARAIATIYAGQVLWLQPGQKQAFAANAICLRPERVWMSAVAESALSASERQALKAWGFSIGAVGIGELEKAGGSLRCCVAEIF